LLKDRLSRKVPSVGICLGAQLLASAAGARVFQGNAGLELGVFPIQRTLEGRKDPVFAELPDGLCVAHWHQDTFEPVRGGKLLAMTTRYPQQAFRLGNSYGIQFHPELTAEVFTSWLRGARPEEVSASGAQAEEIIARQLPLLAPAQPHLERMLDRLAVMLAESRIR
jgi:GMP synthase (glutamine-hydrolysing)